MDGRETRSVLSVRVRGGDRLGEGEEVVTQIGELGGEVVLGARELDHQVDVAAAAETLHGIDLALDRLHAEQVLQESVRVGEADSVLAHDDIGVVATALAAASGVELGDDEFAWHWCALSCSPCGEDEAELGQETVVVVARFEDYSPEAELPVGAEDVALCRLLAAASGNAGVEGDELAARTVPGVDRGVHFGCACRDVDKAVVLGLGQGDDAVCDRIEAVRVEDAAALPLVPLDELTLGGGTLLSRQGPQVEGFPVAGAEEVVDSGRKRPVLEEFL